MSKFRIIDVSGLGMPALVVNTTGPKLLLLDGDLPHDDRVKILARFFQPGEQTT
jgi:hypothetical protein